MDGDVVDLSVKKGSSSTMPNSSRSSSGRGRRELVSPDISLPLPFTFNQFLGNNNNVIPQVQVPHDLTRLVSMLRERDELTSTISSPSNRASSVPSALLTSTLLPQMNLSATSGNSALASRKQSSTTNLKRKRSQNQDIDNFCLPQSQFTSPTHPVRRSLRPRAERSYAESPDIVVDYEDEPPAKMNGIASTNGNGHCNEGEDTSDTDSDCGEMPPLPVIKELSPEEVEEREKLLEALREQVRNEETKLVLLKKIRQSQIMKENMCIPQSNNNLASNLSINSAHTPSSQSPINSHSSSPNITGFNMSTGMKGRASPKLPSGNNHIGSISQGNSSRHIQSSPNKSLGSSSKVPSLLKGPPAPARGSSSNQLQTPISNLMMPPQPQRNSSNSSVPHNLLMAQQSLLRGSRGNSQSAANMMLNFGSNPPGAIPPPTISPALDKYERPKEAHSGSNTSTQQLFSNPNIVEGKLNNVSLSTGPVVSGPSSTVTTPINTLAKNSPGVPLSSTVDQAERRHRLATTNEEDRETPAQRQAAAKLALRKQLEKTLLQIPPPKPPPPEMNFIPNPSNMEFLALIGLEFVVDYITRDQNLQSPAPDAVTCIQCETDFSSMWKLEKGKVICDQCATSNAKKSLKAEHTNRLKTAFVQALQQEQEIEQRLAQGGSLSETLGSVTNSLGRNDSSPSPSHTPTERDRHSPQVSTPSERVGRNRTPTQSPGLVPVQHSLPVRDRDREHKEREREAQREIEKAMAAAMSSAAHFRDRESNRERNSRANNDSLNLSAHSQHSFTQQLKLEMAQLAQMHEQQLQHHQQQQQQQQQQQLQLAKHSSRGSNKNNSNMMNSSRGEKREKERDAYRDRGDSSHASNLLSMTLGHTMANQLLSQNIQNLTMGGQASSSGGNHSSSQKSSSGQGGSRRHRNMDQSHKQPSMSKQQKIDAEAAAKFASALGMSGSGSSSSGLNPSAVAAAAALQAAHQQMLRMPQNQQLPAHLLPFSPLLYPYQMMASGKPVTQASLADLQRQAESLQQLQRQYLLDMIPNSRNLPQNWKT